MAQLLDGSAGAVAGVEEAGRGCLAGPAAVAGVEEAGRGCPAGPVVVAGVDEAGRGCLAGPVVAAGVDEAGRGCLAGPVVAAAVVLHADRPIAGLADSKRLGPATRRRLARAIRRRARAFAVALATPREIDEINILQASLRAMERAVLGLRTPPDLVQVDGNQAPRFDGAGRFAVRTVVGGDRRVAAISAASILAKVYRDRLMGFWHRRYPGYGFDAHKGYPTPFHLAALDRIGPCALHRRSFAPVHRAGAGRSGR